ncbi:MAG: DUF4097 family beta strand repeat protein [Gemmatimonadetes bacterium]|jgi:DUF4097 and DUF4098 domain-containing protein YvlB|nr:DUF4097 family beta strand repeat protein [Gemmatimonadota bacterium]MBT4612194.1 DUF4097 family beta strand repeat protein [Gemmatimonadota bacterium]MBT5058698.1 DUF4097 family beta strand repeat protein [Gemmatimonadota bacterium]MBT5145860.1 DUF4097 family beta strand repeat protein [Gemmatimonadota bacterium]MBT5587841.1 DUF4097 family beta strand repeat protein [Gemmatimonadota bacterium]
MKLIRNLSYLALLCAVAVQAEKDVDERVNAPRNGEVEIENIAGSVRVEGWSEDAVEVKGTLGENLELQLENSGRRTMVIVKYPERRDSRYQHADIVVRLPVASEVSIETVSADVEASSISGPVQVESVSGGVELDIQSKDVDVESVSGDIELRATKAEIQAEAVSGDVEIHVQEGNVDVETVSGDIAVVSSKLTGGDAQSVSGDLDFNVTLTKGCRLDIESHSGDVDLTLPADTSAEIDLEAYSGSMRNRVGALQTGGDGRRELDLIMGSGDSRVEITTFSGDIELRAK